MRRPAMGSLPPCGMRAAQRAGKFSLFDHARRIFLKVTGQSRIPKIKGGRDFRNFCGRKTEEKKMNLRMNSILGGIEDEQ